MLTREMYLWTENQTRKCPLIFSVTKAPIIRTAKIIASFNILTMLKIYVHKKNRT